MAIKLTRLTHKIAIKLHLMTESCTICSFRSRRPVRKLLDTLSYVFMAWYLQFYLYVLLSLPFQRVLIVKLFYNVHSATL